MIDIRDSIVSPEFTVNESGVNTALITVPDLFGLLFYIDEVLSGLDVVLLVSFAFGLHVDTESVSFPITM